MFDLNREIEEALIIDLSGDSDGAMNRICDAMVATLLARNFEVVKTYFDLFLKHDFSIGSHVMLIRITKPHKSVLEEYRKRAINKLLVLIENAEWRSEEIENLLRIIS